MRSARRLFTSASMVLASATSLSASTQTSVAFSDWFKADHVVVTTSAPDAPGFSRTEFHTAPSGDSMIHVESTDGQHTQKGVILLISGSWIATKDLKLEHGYEIDAIDAPALEVQLALQLLSRAVPTGPGTVGFRQPLNVQEKNSPIHVATSSAEGTYGTPWTLVGFVQRKAAQVVEFDLTFTFTAEASQHKFHIVGSAEQLRKPFHLADTFSLIGWNVLRLGPYTETTTKGTIAEYGARPVEPQFKTIGDLRKAASKQKQK